nr:MAG TPA: hypothetical protein [Caudoviricetes sp.]
MLNKVPKYAKISVIIVKRVQMKHWVHFVYWRIYVETGKIKATSY